MVEDRKVDYINSKRLDKPLVALEIIKAWRSQDPPGRFLKIDDKTGLWNDVGDKKAREKTSQALREKAPIIRKQQEDEERARIRREKGLPPEEDSEEETTEPLKADALQRPNAVMARDTTFGVEYIDAGQTVTLEGFSWHEGIGDSQRVPSGNLPPPPHAYPPGSREASFSTAVPPPPMPHQYPYTSNGSMPPPTSSGRFESWSSLPPVYAAAPPPGGWGDREHSLGQFALPHASVGHPASYATFDPHRPPYSPHAAPPPAYPPVYAYSGGPLPPPPPPPPPAAAVYQTPLYGSSAAAPTGGMSPVTASSSPRPKYSVDPSVASTWSGKPQEEILQTFSGDNDGERAPGIGDKDVPSPALHKPIVGVKPDIVKRATSNQNETFETKPDLIGGAVKRAALNRDSSNAANRLKELCFPGQFKNGTFDVHKEVNELSADMGRSTLGTPVAPGQPQRESTLDMLPPIQDSISEESPQPQPPIVRPSILESRTTTMDAIAASLSSEDDVMATLGRVESVGAVDLPKPNAWGFSDRLTTTDLMQMVNEPLAPDDPELVSGRRQAL